MADLVIPEKYKILPSDSEEVKIAKKKKVHQLKSAHRLKKVYFLATASIFCISSTRNTMIRHLCL